MRRYLSLALLFLLIAAAPLQAHALFGITDESQDKLAPIFEQIEKNGPTDPNIAALEKFVKEYSSSQATDEALFRLATIYMEKRNFQKAALNYKTLVEKFPASKLKTDAIFGLGYAEYRKGNLREAKAVLTSFLELKEASITNKVKARHILNTLTSVESSVEEKAGAASIAALLPLSGPYSVYGDKALKGIMLAAEVYGKSAQQQAEPLTTTVYDTEVPGVSVDKLMTDTVETISKTSGAVGIIGPLLSKNAEILAKTAQQKGIPSIILSQKEGVPQIGDYIFRNFVTPSQQTSTLAEYTVKTLGLTDIAVLYPDNALGKELATDFIKAVNERGGKIVAQLSYPPDKKDFSDELVSLFKVKSKDKMEGRRKITEFTPELKAQALFIPDNYATVAQIAPFLAYYSIKNVQLLGSNGWNSPELTKLSGEYVNGAVFVDGYYPDTSRKGSAEFSKLFQEVYGYAPGVIEAHAYDSTLMLLNGIKTAGSTDKSKIRSALETAYEIEGATGKIRFDADGEAKKELFILKIVKGNIVEVTK